jgi:tight adherence protein C
MSAYIPYIGAGLAFVSVLVFSLGLGGFLDSRKRVGSMRHKLGGPARGGEDETPRGLRQWLNAAMAGLFQAVGERLQPKDEEERMQGRLALVRAGLRQPGAHLVYWGVKGGMALLLSGAFLTAKVLLMPDLPLLYSSLGAVSTALVGVYLPSIWLRSRIKSRKTEFLNGLPDALDLLVVCVESGMGLDQALQRVGQEMRTANAVLSDELRILSLELRAGKSRKDGLRDMAERVDLEDMTSLVTLLIQSDAFGTSVAHTLRVYSDALRTKRYQRAEEQAAKLPVKLLFPLILFILPALFVVIMGPATITLMGVFAKGN